MNIPGLSCGVIEDELDPEKRGRYRVRVFCIHQAEVPTATLPWAECAGWQGQFFGDYIPLAKGDFVWVGFEGGDSRFPIIVGLRPSFRGGMPPFTSRLTGDYAESHRRWIRLDRAGNMIEMSPLGDELHVRLASGQAEVTVSQLDQSIVLRAAGRVLVIAPNVQVQSTNVTVEAETLTAAIAGDTVVHKGKNISLQGADKISIGRYTSPLGGDPETTKKVDVHASEGVDVVSEGPINLTTEKAVHMKSDTTVTIEGDGDMAIKAGGKLSINIDGSAEIQVGGSCTASVGGPLNVEAKGNASLDVQGNVEVKANGLLDLSSDSLIQMRAPTIMIEAFTLLSLTSIASVLVSGAANVTVTGATGTVGIGAPLVAGSVTW